MSVTVIQFITLDGVVQDPDGSDGTPGGGWACRFGPEAVAGDKFKLGPLLESGVFLYGRKTWEQFARIWPGRSDDFSMAMNRTSKLVASRSLTNLEAWHNSAPLAGDLVDEVTRLRADRDLIVIGSLSVVHALAEHDLIDEYRLLVFPTVLGEGRRLFDAVKPTDLRLVSVEQSGAAVLLRHERTR
jgi:dihydrofolate reductase